MACNQVRTDNIVIDMSIRLYCKSCTTWCCCAGNETPSDGKAILYSLSHKLQYLNSCMLVFAVKVIKLYVLECAGRRVQNLTLVSWGAHSWVDLGGIKVKRNVSKLQRLLFTAELTGWEELRGLLTAQTDRWLTFGLMWEGWRAEERRGRPGEERRYLWEEFGKKSVI